jgi:hypothetical protein
MKRIKTKKSTITLAIDSDVLMEIRKEAEARGLSINAKINTILTKYVIFYRRAEELDSQTVPNKTFRFLLDNIDEVKLLQEFKSNAMDIVHSLHLEQNTPLTLDNLVKFTVEGIGLNAGVFHSFSYFKDEFGDPTLVLKHNYGIKWSRIIGAGYSYMIENVSNYPARCAKILQSSVVIRILEKEFPDNKS